MVESNKSLAAVGAPTTPATVNDYLLRAGGRPDGGLRFLDRSEQARWLGWGDLRREALAVCASLRAMGIERGDRVALVFPTCEEFFAAFFGALLAGAVPVPLYPPVRLGRLQEYFARTARMLDAAGARLVLAEPRVKRFLGEAVAPVRPPLGCRTLADLARAAAAAGPAEAAPVQVRGGDLALVQFSSGTTVAPKAVALSHRALVSQTEILNACWPDESGLRHSCASWLPLYHDMGLIGCVFPALARDATLTLLPPELFVARPALWLRAIARYRATISPAPNFGYSLCLSRVTDAEMAGCDLSCWRTALNGAEPVAPSVLRAFAARFARWGFSPAALTPVYGLSEAALAVTFSSLGRPFRSRWFDREALAREGSARPGESAEGGGRGAEIVSVGEPLPGFRLAVRDEQGRDLAAGRVGRLWVQGPSLMDGYLGDPESTARTLRDGWLDTGDLGFLAEGELYLTGRAKDIIILRGRNHSPAEIEQAVDAVAGARPGCAVAVSWLPEGAAGEVLALFIERSRRATAGEVAMLPDACREAILGATGLVVERVEVLEPGSLPRTSSGKLRRSEALRLYLEGGLTPPAPVNVLRLAGAVARSSMAYARWRLERRGSGSA
jgi:fatty-acyl-CoA synthase